MIKIYHYLRSDNSYLYAATQDSPSRWSMPETNPNKLELIYSGQHPNLYAWTHVLTVSALSPTLTDSHPEIFI